jgi:CO/xanthine dehydrogenase FAD-binding subunit
VQILRPADWPEALALRSARADAVAIAGGTDVMVAMKMQHLRPAALLDLSQLPGISRCQREPAHVRIGAGATLTYISEHFPDCLPGLAMAAGRAGSRQVRNRATIGGSLGTAAPAGDLHPALLASGAQIQLRSASGTRWVPAGRFYLAGGRTALAAGELISAVRVPMARGPQRFIKIGRRQGLIKTMCSFAVAIDAAGKRVSTGAGALGPSPCRALAAENLLAIELARANAWGSRQRLDPGLLARFGRSAALAADPVTDLYATAEYRRHALAVLAQRSLAEAWESYRVSGS